MTLSTEDTENLEQAKQWQMMHIQKNQQWRRDKLENKNKMLTKAFNHSKKSQQT